MAEFKPQHCYNSSEDEPFLLNNETDLSYNYESGLISFFKVEDNRLQFSTDMGYGITTANSNYIRSELRELFNAENIGSCSTGTDATSWKILDSTTDTKRHTLTSTLRIDEYPQITGRDPKVVVGQVHGWEIKQALVKVLWEGDAKPVRVALNQDFFVDNKACSNNESNCDSWPFSIEMGTYKSDVDWQYQITVDNAGIYLVTQQADGTDRVQHQLYWGDEFSNTKGGEKITMSEDWTDESIAYYFKAGIYPQFKPDQAYVGQRFSVSFSQVDIVHE